jgi:hypothetical protein
VEPRSSALEADEIDAAQESNGTPDARRPLLIAAAVGVTLLILAGLVFGVVSLVRSPGTAEALRDAVIVLIGIQSLITGTAVIVLIVQVARLSALIQNEVRPMLEASSETLRTVRGTTEFLSDKMIRPVVRLNAAGAALRRALELVGLARFR